MEAFRDRGVHPIALISPTLPDPSLLRYSCIVYCIDASRQYDLLAQHIATLRSLPQLKDAWIVLGVECNLGQEAQHILHGMRLRKVDRIIPLHEGPMDTPGMLTTNSSKEIMCHALQELLSMDRLALSRRMVCCATDPREALNRLAHELRQFMVIVEPPRTAFGQPRRTFGGKQGGQNDDLCVALQLAVMTTRLFRSRPRYSRFQ